MKKFYVLLVCGLLSFDIFAQIAQGPAAGMVEQGSPVTVSMFANHISSGVILPRKPKNKIPPALLPAPPDMIKPLAPEGANFMTDPNISMKFNLDDTSTGFLFKSFEGIPQTNSIPPDPYLAVGPNHIIQTVNSDFRICNKEGITLKTISADSWFSNVLANADAFDPKVIYDHIDERWVMVWLSQDDNTKTAYFLVSVSDDSDPFGTWYNYAMPSNVIGTTKQESWADYQGVGYDDNAIYLTANQFAFGGNFQFSRLRIIDKTYLYANNGGPVYFNDFWNIRHPSPMVSAFTLRPARMYTPINEFYMIASSPYSPGTFISLFKVYNSVTNPAITAVSIPVTLYNSAPNANQLGGGTLSIETGGSRFSNEPIFKDGKLHMVHSTAFNNQFSAVRYLCINPQTNTVIDDIAMGANGYWHFYPAVAVNQDNDVVITYSRSGQTEYIGAFLTSKKAGSKTLSGSKILKEGKANYVKDFNSGRNRWGDYMGAWFDPVDQNSLWVMSQYVSSLNTWATYVGGFRLRPFENPYVEYEKGSLDFGIVEKGYETEVKRFKIKNYGTPPINISGITVSNPNFKLLNNLNYPLYLSTFDSLILEVKFAPSDTGSFNEQIVVNSNAINVPVLTVPLTGKSYEIKSPVSNTLYATGRQTNINNLLQIDKTTGAASIIGQIGFNNITSLTYNPVSREINALYFGNTLVRVNAGFGDFYHYIPLKDNYKIITYNYLGELLGINTNDIVYLINPSTGDTTFISALKTSVNNLIFRPYSYEAWATASSTHPIKDAIYKINIVTGDTTFIGRTGFNVLTNSIAFDNSGRLFGVRGTVLQVTPVFTIDTLTGKGADIGSSGFRGVTGLVINTDTLTSQKEFFAEIPKQYALYQNYPNPFNPKTNISYTLPERGYVTLKIYNVLGKEIKTLVNDYQEPGNYKVDFNAVNLSSGVYFYELISGRFREIKKMQLIK